MAGLNVAEWTPEQVAEWLSGLGPSVAQYVPGLRARGLAGAKLLTLRCDDLDYLGVPVIGHQELILEAVEHLRNFQYELSRECIQQLALRVCVCGTGIVRALRAQAAEAEQGGGAAGAAVEGRLDTQLLADVARCVRAVKPLVRWLDAAAPDGELAARRAQLLQLALEAATIAMRDRFADHPHRAVGAAAAAAGAAAGGIVRSARDPRVLAGAALHAVTLRPRRAELGFRVRRSHAGLLQLASVRFGSPAHASGQVQLNDEIVQVGSQCVLGWGAEEVERLCAAGAARGELALRLVRRAARPPAPAALARRRRLQPEPEPEPEPASDGSEPLSPPASPTTHHQRMYPEKPHVLVSRRHSVSGASPAARAHLHTIDPFWQQLKERRRAAGGSAAGSPEPDDVARLARDKAVSCSTGLELPRPRTCPAPPRPPPPASPATDRRGKLDKAHSTPAYDLAQPDLPPAQHQPIPESPTTPGDSPTVVVHSAAKADQILAFKKSSSAIGEAMQHRRHHDDSPAPGSGVRDESTTEKILETINIAMMEHRRRSLLEHERARAPGKQHYMSESSDATPNRYMWGRRESPPAPPPRPAPPARPPASLPVLRAVPRPDRDPASPVKLTRPIDVTQISAPLRHLTGHEVRSPGALNSPPAPRPAPSPAAPAPSTPSGPSPPEPRPAALSPTAAVRAIFPITAKARSLKKKSSILAKRRCVPYKVVVSSGTATSGVWQRVRARAGAAQPRWARRTLLLAHNLLYAYKSAECSRAACMVYLEGYTAAAAAEVKSRAHAFKVYHTGVAFYFACESRDAMLAWIQLIHRATLLPSLRPHMDVSRHYSETDYSETESDTENTDRRSDKDRDRDNKERDKDKSKFGSLKKLTGRMQRSESQENVSHSSTSLDRKYLRFFSRHKSKDDSKPKNKQAIVAVPTEHYRSYRRVAPPTTDAPHPTDAPNPSDAPILLGSELRASKKIPKPINYIHASNPNLLDFEKSDFVTKPALQVPAKPKTSKVESLTGLVTLEQFMLQKQEEERRQLYSNRVLRGIERDRQQRQETIVPDVIYGEVLPPDIPLPVLELQAAPPAPAPAPAPQVSAASYKERRPSPGRGKPISVKGKDGYEKIVYTDDPPEGEGYVVSSSYGVARERRPAPTPERWRDSLRRNDKVHSREGAVKPAAAGSHSPHDTLRYRLCPRLRPRRPAPARSTRTSSARPPSSRSPTRWRSMAAAATATTTPPAAPSRNYTNRTPVDHQCMCYLRINKLNTTLTEQHASLLVHC